jgi:hypothetical protein
MKKSFLKISMLALIAATLAGGLPLFTQGPSAGLSVSVEAQTRRRRVRRRPALGSTATTTGTVVVPVNTQLKVRLNSTISSKDARVGDRFTANVIDPARYEGATINGHVSSINKSGKVSGRTRLGLAFDSIQLADGSSGTLHGELVRIYDSDSVKTVDEEGNVESHSRSKQALKRGGIGAAAGAIIGGIAGGGKGAAIGLIIGGAGGAGSIAIEGSKELRLEPGTEMLLRVTRR